MALPREWEIPGDVRWRITDSIPRARTSRGSSHPTNCASFRLLWNSFWRCPDRLWIDCTSGSARQNTFCCSPMHNGNTLDYRGNDAYKEDRRFKFLRRRTTQPTGSWIVNRSIRIPASTLVRKNRTSNRIAKGYLPNTLTVYLGRFDSSRELLSGSAFFGG